MNIPLEHIGGTVYDDEGNTIIYASNLDTSPHGHDRVELGLEDLDHIVRLINNEEELMRVLKELRQWLIDRYPAPIYVDENQELDRLYEKLDRLMVDE